MAQAQSVLPEAFAMREDDGTLTQVVDPCYQVMAPVFFGDTWFDEGEIIVTDICPNAHLAPLNRAAGVNMEKWERTLPSHGGIKIDIEDFVEAAMRLRDVPEIKEMPHEKASQYIADLAVKLKHKRDTVHGLAVPPVAGNEARIAYKNVPPMPNLRFTDPHRGGPGIRERVLHDPQRAAPVARNAKRQAAPV